MPDLKVKLIILFHFYHFHKVQAHTHAGRSRVRQCFAFLVNCYLNNVTSMKLLTICKKNCLWFITSEADHVEIRNLTMMILLPRKLHMDDATQSAFVRAAVSRVSSEKNVNLFIYVKIANPTVLEPRGISFLHPIWEMITDRWPHVTWGLDLKESDVDVYYTKYINNFKRALQAGERSIEQAVDDRLTPGENKL